MKRPIAFLVAAVATLLTAGPGSSQSREYLVVGSGGGEDDGAVTTYLLDRNTGDLTQVDRETVGRTVSFVALNPELPVLYATDERGAAVYWLSIDPRTGVLTPGGQHVANGNPVYLSVDATASTLLGVNYGRGTVDAFPLDGRTGAISGAPTVYETGANSHSAIFDPASEHVYVAAVADNKVSQYAFRDGALTPLDPPALAQEGGVRHIVMHPSGDYVYGVAGPTDNIVALRVADDGTLSTIESVRRLTPDHSPDAGTHMGSDIHVTPNGRFLYAANRGTSNSIVVYSIGSDGRLTLVEHESTAGSTPRNFALDPDGRLLAVGNQASKTVAVFAIDQQTGVLNHLHTEEVGVTPWFVGIWRVDE